MTKDMRRDFANRDELVEYLRQQFPEAAAVSDEVSEMQGGRKAAEARLREVQPDAPYSKTRNYLDGAVSRLSAYIRYGVLSLAEVRDYALRYSHNSYEVEKFINELAWRDYWQRLYKQLGDGIWDDQEAYKTGYTSDDYADDLPEDIRNGHTELACMDAFSHALNETGYLHNHARMWLAAYIVHWRRIKWQTGARWFLEHLLDGDPASNNLSWQWVASTFSHKPYFFNRENLETYTRGIYCETCPLRKRCPFEGSYEALERRLFAAPLPEREPKTRRTR